MPLTASITERDHVAYMSRRDRYDVDNHPLRDAPDESFFDAMLSEDANLARDGFISPEALKCLGE